MKPTQAPIVTAEQLRSMSISQIAYIIRKDWKKPYFGSVPYLDAMLSLESIEDNYIFDSGRSVVLTFLSNASSYRGPTAKLVKAELNSRLKAGRKAG